jgi:FMN hydrolase / 5-amino-6-(5-phospho-D-ribitylamino)uracil phosphatase
MLRYAATSLLSFEDFMRIYKALSPIKALSFDLDDTLYPNADVIQKAELAMQRRLRQLLGAVDYNQPEYWWQQRKNLALLQPQAMTAFVDARTDIELPVQIRPMLEQLAARYPLVAITNGNADIHKMGIADLFQFSLRAGPDGRMKPYPDLFLNATQRLQIAPSQLLHIGDHVKSDVLGALHAGCQAAWLNLTPGSVQGLKTLPHLEISNVLELTQL